jgi:hypothetical protein
VPVVAAVRAAIRTALAELTPTDGAERFERDIALLAVPELWSANLGVLRTALDEALAILEVGFPW